MEKNSKKRILIFSTAYYPFVGGAEVAIKEITDRFSLDYDFDLITARFDSKLQNFEKIGRVSVYRVGSGVSFFDKLLLPVRGFMLANKLNRNHNYDCMWGMMVSFGTGAGYFFNLYRMFTFKKRIPIVLTLQEGDSEAHLKFKWGGLIALSWKLALAQTTHLTAISNFLLNRAKKIGFSGEWSLIPNGVDLGVFGKEVDENVKKDLKLTLNKKDDDIFLVTTGRLTHKNANDDVIHALQKLPENIFFIVIGKGDEGPKLQKLAESLGVEKRVKFLGFVPYSEIPNYFSVCDIFIRPSRSEGFGNSFIEAMAARLPVVATPVGGIVDFISDKETGIFCSPDNPQSIVNAVKSIIDDNNLKQNIVLNAERMVISRYGWEKISKDMEGVFDKLV